MIYIKYLKKNGLYNLFKGVIDMTKATLKLETLTCPSCLQKIERGLKQTTGVKKDSVKVLFNASKVKVDFDENQVNLNTIEKAIEDLGYPVISSKVKEGA
uniref:Copper chaperone n=2 Tax=Lactobacillaceae TaxID=33958 RepID=I6Q8H1_LEUMS|nr:copper chaperone [Leuconostoc mesenteroides subsp. mesenteroides]